MKKVIACMLAALMLAAMLAGCGQQAADDAAPDDTAANAENTLADGVYTADFNTDSSMFHANEACEGKGTIFEMPEVHIEKVFDEHAIINDRAFHDRVQVGDKVRIIPVHICPVCNLYDRAYLISGGEVVQELEIACRGKLQ